MSDTPPSSRSSFVSLPASSKPARIQELSQVEQDELKELFQSIDDDGNGYIDVDELLTLFRTLSIEKSEADVIEMVSQIHPRAPDRIALDEFVELMSTRIEMRSTAEQVKAAFRFFEDDQPGFVDLNKVYDALTSYGQLDIGELTRAVRGGHIGGGHPSDPIFEASTADDVWSRLVGESEDAQLVWVMRLEMLMKQVQDGKVTDVDIEPDFFQKWIQSLLPKAAPGTMFEYGPFVDDAFAL